MRKPRVVIFDDEVFILNMLVDFFRMRGYEVLSYADPAVLCPLLGMEGETCRYGRPCADLMITDFSMPGVNGVELLEHQRRKGCSMDSRNKAVISGYIDERSRRQVQDLGCAFFQKPFTLFSLAEWIDACERRMDLRRPLASRRQEERFESSREITFRMSRHGEIMTGITVNISPSGFCLKLPGPLRTEDTISIHAGHFSTCREASVRWVRKVDESSFLAGLHCLPGLNADI